MDFVENAVVNGSINWLQGAVSAMIFVVMVILIMRKRHPIMIIGLSAIFGIAAGYLLGI